MAKKNLILLDKNGVVGVESPPSKFWETPGACRLMERSISFIVGQLADVEEVLGRPIGRPGEVFVLGGAEYEVRPCRTGSVSRHMRDRGKRLFREAREEVIPDRVSVRRKIFRLRPPEAAKKVYWGKGCAKITPPTGAVAYIGGSEKSVVIFLDRYAQIISAWAVAHDGPVVWATPVGIPRKIDWSDLHLIQ